MESDGKIRILPESGSEIGGLAASSREAGSVADTNRVQGDGMESDVEIRILPESGGETGGLVVSSPEAGSVANTNRVQGDGTGSDGVIRILPEGGSKIGGLAAANREACSMAGMESDGEIRILPKSGSENGGLAVSSREAGSVADMNRVQGDGMESDVDIRILPESSCKTGYLAASSQEASSMADTNWVQGNGTESDGKIRILPEGGGETSSRATSNRASSSVTGMKSDSEIKILPESGGETGSLAAYSREAGSVADTNQVQGDGMESADEIKILLESNGEIGSLVVSNQEAGSMADTNRVQGDGMESADEIRILLESNGEIGSLVVSNQEAGFVADTNRVQGDGMESDDKIRISSNSGRKTGGLATSSREANSVADTNRVQGDGMESDDEIRILLESSGGLAASSWEAGLVTDTNRVQGDGTESDGEIRILLEGGGKIGSWEASSRAFGSVAGMESDDEIRILPEVGGKTGSLVASSREAGSVADMESDDEIRTLPEGVSETGGLAASSLEAGRNRVQGDGPSEAVMANDESTIVMIGEITSSLDSKVTGLPSPASYRGWSIYKVPTRLRKLKEEAYTPKLVSIGPLHHGKPHLKSMERYKLEYCKKFLELTGIGSRDLIEQATKWETVVREHYQDTFELKREQFVEMIVLDGLFIIMHFLKDKFPDIDVIISNQWMLRELVRDMMLLENQLPRFFLEELLRMVPPQLLEGTTIAELTHHYFRDVGNADRFAINDPRRHFVEYLQTLHFMSFGVEVARSKQKSENPWSATKRSATKEKSEYPRSATELYAAGIRFLRSEDHCILNIIFTENGELTIPQLKVNNWTETLFRNLIAFEQCDHQPECISSYIVFLDCLINTPMDVELLVECNIIENDLGDSELVSDLFNNLYKETFTEYSVFYYTDICRQLNAYNKDYWHQWRAALYRWNVILKRDYFSNPWSGISVIAAIILLLLTVTQTVCSIMGL